jgi:hypothetical protein
MNACNAHECGYCRSTLGFGQRWVREKVFDPAPQTGVEPSYRRYHAEVFSGEQLSCWEKHQMEQEMARTIARAA